MNELLAVWLTQVLLNCFIGEMERKTSSHSSFCAAANCCNNRKSRPDLSFFQVSHGSVCITSQNTGDSININDLVQRNRPLHTDLASATKTSRPIIYCCAVSNRADRAVIVLRLP